MQLVNFRVSNFRSISDSGKVETKKATAILGRNESGKTNLLLALHSLNPAGGIKPLVPIKDFPRHRRLEECTDETIALESTWELSAAERELLGATWPRAKGVRHVQIARDYKGRRTIEFGELPPLKYTGATASQLFTPVADQVRQFINEVEEPHKAALSTALASMERTIAAAGLPGKLKDQAAAINASIPGLRSALTAAGKRLSDSEDGSLSVLQKLASEPADDTAQSKKARELVEQSLPVFVYLDEYPDFDGHHDVASFVQRKNQNGLTETDRNFEKLCKVAGLNPIQLNDLYSRADHETRGQLANRAGAVITSELRRLWKDRPLKVRFGLDAQHLDTLISDPNATYDVEVNLNERSRGFRWFFSFYVTFAADTKGGSSENAVLLLDEPGLYLHAGSQSDLLRHLRHDLKNQVVFTTHSPFMVPVDELDAVRTVKIDQDDGTTVTNSPTGDERTLFPLQAALGFNLAQTLFVGPNNLVVEGVTDYWYVSSISEYLRSTSRPALPSALTITPAGGAQKVGYMVALLASERLNVVVLLDKEPSAERTGTELTKEKLIRGDNIIFITAGFVGNSPSEADIEDLLDPTIFNDLVLHTYANELAGKQLVVNDKIPRIVRRYEEAFAALGLDFHKSRPAREFLRRMASNPTSVLTIDARARFEKLFAEIDQCLSRHLARDRSPFQ